MRLALLLCAIVAIRVGGYNFIVGDVKTSGRLAHHEVIEYYSIPFLRRSKKFTYTHPKKWPITGVKAIDWLYCENTMKIIRGGLGRYWVTLKMLSQRGKGFYYDTYIYVDRPNSTTTTEKPGNTTIKTTLITTPKLNTTVNTTKKKSYYWAFF